MWLYYATESVHPDAGACHPSVSLDLLRTFFTAPIVDSFNMSRLQSACLVRRPGVAARPQLGLWKAPPDMQHDDLAPPCPDRSLMVSTLRCCPEAKPDRDVASSVPACLESVVI